MEPRCDSSRRRVLTLLAGPGSLGRRRLRRSGIGAAVTGDGWGRCRSAAARLVIAEGVGSSASRWRSSRNRSSTGTSPGDVMFMELADGAPGSMAGSSIRPPTRHPMALARRIECIRAGLGLAPLPHAHRTLRWSDGAAAHRARRRVHLRACSRDPDLASPLQNYGEHLDSVVARRTTPRSSSTSAAATRRCCRTAALAIIPRHVFGDTPPGEICAPTPTPPATRRTATWW